VVFSGNLSCGGHPSESCSLCTEGRSRRNIFYLRVTYLYRKLKMHFTESENGANDLADRFQHFYTLSCN